MPSALRVCANCRVLVQPAGSASLDTPSATWEHVPEFAGKFSRSVCAEAAPGREASGSEIRFGLARVKTPGGDKQVIKGQIEGISSSPGEPIVVAVDGSYKLTVGERVIKPMSWAYVSTDGKYGLGTSIVPGTVVGEHRALQAELRAMANALHAIGDDNPITIVSDSQDAIGFMTLWRDGYQVWPGGYDPQRAGGRESTLGRLARRAYEQGDQITLEWVPGHTGHPLNEAADALARMARAWTADRLDKDTAAADARTAVLAALSRYSAAAV
jgi:ribonuclease HI